MQIKPTVHIRVVRPGENHNVAVRNFHYFALNFPQVGTYVKLNADALPVFAIQVFIL